MVADPLSQLHDIYFPPPISWWPLAIGWYFLMGLILIGLLFAGYIWYRSIKKRRLKKLVLHRLTELQKVRDIESVSEELSMLLKRAALARYPRRQVAGLHGEEWLKFLDRTAMTTDFSNGPGRLLLICPYQGKKHLLPDQLFHLIKNWVKKNL